MTARDIGPSAVDRLVGFRQNPFPSHGGITQLFGDWAKYELEQENVRLLDLEDLRSDSWVVVGSLIGSPIAMLESLPSGRELDLALPVLERQLGKPISAVLPLNRTADTLLTLLALCARSGLPMLDADSVGRSFPAVEQNMLTLAGLSATPAVLASPFGETLQIDTPFASSIERIGRPSVLHMGGWAFVLSYPALAGDLAGVIAPGTVSSLLDGESLAAPRAPFLSAHGRITRVHAGSVASTEETTAEANLRVSVRFLSEGRNARVYRVEGLNEWNRVVSSGRELASLPDIVLLLDDNNRELPVDEVAVGMHAQLVAIRAPEIWYTPQGRLLAEPFADPIDVDVEATE